MLPRNEEPLKTQEGEGERNLSGEYVKCVRIRNGRRGKLTVGTESEAEVQRENTEPWVNGIYVTLCDT